MKIKKPQKKLTPRRSGCVPSMPAAVAGCISCDILQRFVVVVVVIAVVVATALHIHAYIHTYIHMYLHTHIAFGRHQMKTRLVVWQSENEFYQFIESEC